MVVIVITAASGGAMNVAMRTSDAGVITRDVASIMGDKVMSTTGDRRKKEGM